MLCQARHVRTGPGAVAQRLAAVLDGAVASPVGADDIEAIRADLDAAARRAVELIVGHDEVDALPLRLPKGRVVALGSCERHALAVFREQDTAVALVEEMSVPMLRGRALDAFVEHEIVAGPVADPLEDLLSWLDACGEQDVRDQAIAAGEILELAPLASAARDWAGIDPAWWPRTQAAVAAHLADGAVRCEGRTDVELGGPLSGRPGVVVEVKLGRPHSGHLTEITHYALLVALRDRAAPVSVARWYPGGALAEMTVTTDVLHTAARRLADAILTWAQLLAGRPSVEHPGPMCGWCPDADVCPSFEPAPDPFDDGVT